MFVFIPPGHNPSRAERLEEATAKIPTAVRTFISSLVREIRDDRATGLAAEIAFYAVLSIFPWLLLITAVLGSLDVLIGSDLAERSKEVVVDFLSRILTQEGAGAVEAVRAVFEDERAGLLSVSAVIAVWASARGFAATMIALNLAFDTNERRSWIDVRLRAVALSVVSVLVGSVLLVAFVVGPLLGGGRAVAGAIGAGSQFTSVWEWARWPLGLVVVILSASMVYAVGPSDSPRWRENIPGAVLAATFWLLASIAFGIYLRVAASGNLVYGLLGGGLVLLVWLYVLAFGLILGAEVNALLAHRKPLRPQS